MIIEWFDITGFTNIHVYTHTPNYIYNSGVGGIIWTWRENNRMSNNEHFGWNFFVWRFLVIYIWDAIAKFPKFDTQTSPFKMWQVFPFVGNIQGGDEFLKSIHVVTFLHIALMKMFSNLILWNVFGHFVIKSVYFGLWNKNSNIVWFRTVFCQTYHCMNPQSIFNRKLLISQFFHLPCDNSIRLDKIIEFPSWQCSNMTETKMDNAHNTPDD